MYDGLEGCFWRGLHTKWAVDDGWYVKNATEREKKGRKRTNCVRFGLFSGCLACDLDLFYILKCDCEGISM